MVGGLVGGAVEEVGGEFAMAVGEDVGGDGDGFAQGAADGEFALVDGGGDGVDDQTRGGAVEFGGCGEDGAEGLQVGHYGDAPLVAEKA